MHLFYTYMSCQSINMNILLKKTDNLIICHSENTHIYTHTRVYVCMYILINMIYIYYNDIVYFIFT